MFRLLAFVLCIRGGTATYVISVYGDVYQDWEFFSRTYPWIIDNIGGEIMVDYYLQGSGRHTVPQMCALSELRMNTFLQAQYLKCEADGNSSENCLCQAGVDPNKYKQCVLGRGSLASLSASKYNHLGIDARPVIEIGYKNTVFGVEDSWYLKKICTIFGDNPPRGCVKPFACNATEKYSDRESVVQFNCQRTLTAELAVSLVDRNEQEVTTSEPYTATSTTESDYPEWGRIHHLYI